MIDSLYDCFKHWSAKGSVYIISDTHFDDPDCELMDPEWIPAEEQIGILKKFVHRNDTLIHLGDVGNPEYMKQLKCYKVLIMGNHDTAPTRMKEYFDEVYTGPLAISDKIILSHEPIGVMPVAPGTKPVMFNIHGHVHCDQQSLRNYWLNLAADVCGYMPISLGNIIKGGLCADIVDIHRQVIDRAKEKK